ncbi:MAG TPA: putative C-S lyase [Leucothrix sp.]|nr:putative C-S lyase [Leucothrix sp.]
MSQFDKIIDRKNTFSEKWDKYKGKDIIPMWVADSDFEVAPEIVEALQQRVVHGVFGYSEQPTTGVQNAIQYHLKSQHGWEIDKNWIVPLPSLVSGLSLSCLMTDAKGDEVVEIVTPQTIYPPFKYVIDNNKRQRIEVPVRLETSSDSERWVLDLDAFEKAITPQTKLLLFCNPHNPAGTVYTKEELEQVHDICKRHDLLICSDEIHCDLVLDENKKHIPLAMLNDDAKNRSITLMAASKTFNVPGLGFGFAIIPSDTLRDKFKVLVRQRMPDINILAQTATEAAFKQGESWRLEQIEYLRGNRDYLMQEINAIEGLKMYPLEATFLAWIDVSGLGLDDPETFFEEAGVGISAGKYFGDDNCIRLNFACRRSLLEEAVGRIKKVLEAL